MAHRIDSKDVEHIKAFINSMRIVTEDVSLFTKVKTSSVANSAIETFYVHSEEGLAKLVNLYGQFHDLTKATKERLPVLSCETKRYSDYIHTPEVNPRAALNHFQHRIHYCVYTLDNTYSHYIFLMDVYE